MEVALLPVILYLSYKYSFYNPTRMVIFYILLSSKVLGFMDPAKIIIGGIELGTFSVNIIMFASVFFYRGWYKVDKFIAPVFFVIAIILLMAIIAPVIREFENFKQAVTASKNFLYVALFFYMFVRKDEINIYSVMNFMKYLGLYLGVLQTIAGIVPALGPFMPPQYAGILFIRIYYPTYVSLSLFIFFAEWQQGKIATNKFLFFFIFLALGMILSGFAALATFSLASLAFIYFVWHDGVEKDSYRSIKKIIFAIIFAITLFAASWQLREAIAEMQQGISSGDDVALRTREMYNKFRWDAIKSSPIIGMGFIHKSAPIMKKYNVNKSRFMEKFDVIDSGYVDLFVRFGYLGTAVYLFTIALYIISVLIQESPPPYALAAAGYLLPYYPMCYTWSVFTFPHGTIPLAIAIFMIFRFRPYVPYYKVYT